LCGQFHTEECSPFERIRQLNVAARRFVPPLKRAGFCACGMSYQRHMRFL
jgi:hypothetical protein